jgi:glycerol kinase
MEKDTGVPLKALKVDGGASRDGFLMQFQADILGVDVVKPAMHEATALGAASLAGLTVGLWESEEQLRAMRAVQTVYHPMMERTLRDEKMRKWHKAVQRSLAWEEN